MLHIFFSYSGFPLEKTLTLHDVVIHIKSGFNEDQNLHYYDIFLEKCSYQLVKKNIFFDNIMMRFDWTIEQKKNFMVQKTPNIWDVNVNNIVISKLIETKTNSKYLIGYLDKVIKPLVLILLKISGHIKNKLKIKMEI